MRKRLTLFGVLVLFVATMLIAWYFSAQDATTSYDLSGCVTERIFVYCPWLNKVSAVGELMPIIRKIAHFVLYTVLGVVISVALMVLQGADWSLTQAILVGAVLSILDEFHQAFVPGRHACVDDVLVDVLGVCVGIILAAVGDVTRRAFSHKSRL